MALLPAGADASGQARTGLSKETMMVLAAFCRGLDQGYVDGMGGSEDGPAYYPAKTAPQGDEVAAALRLGYLAGRKLPGDEQTPGLIRTVLSDHWLGRE